MARMETGKRGFELTLSWRTMIIQKAVIHGEGERCRLIENKVYLQIYCIFPNVQLPASNLGPLGLSH